MQSSKFLCFFLCLTGILVCSQAYSLQNPPAPYIDTPSVSGTIVSQTVTPAGYDIGKVGDVYIFTQNQYWDGSSWITTETSYMDFSTLKAFSVSSDVSGLPEGTAIYVGYGMGLMNTFAAMQKTGTFTNAYTTGLESSKIWYKDADTVPD